MATLLSTNEVAALARVRVGTVNGWVRERRLVPTIEMPGKTGARLFDPATVAAFLAARDATDAEQAAS